MKAVKINADIRTLDGEPLDTVLDEIRCQVDQLYRKSEFSIYNDPSHLDLVASTMTIMDAINSLPRNSVLMFDAIQASYPAFSVPLNSSGSRMSGFVSIHKGYDISKAYVRWQNELYVAYLNYNSNVVPALGQWIFARDYFPVQLAPGSFSNKLSNVVAKGEYYCTGANASIFTDSPTGFPFFLSVKFNGGDILQEIVSNNLLNKRYVRQVSSGTARDWVRTPQVYLNQADSSLDVGDISVRGGIAYICKTKGTSVAM